MENIFFGVIFRVLLLFCIIVVDDWFLVYMDGWLVVNIIFLVLVVVFEIILMYIIIYFKKIYGYWILIVYVVIVNILSFWYNCIK